nr:unnamed protein product [Digitaria exilis]
MGDLKNELEGYNTGDSDEVNKQKAIDALKRMENWNLFRDTKEEHHSYTVARDSFLAQLGSMLWGSMRHVIAPSVSHRAHHYYEKLSFQLYFVTQEKVRSIKQLPVNIKSITESLNSVLLRHQKSMFSQHLLSLSEEPALMMAFSMARRAAAVPLLLVNGGHSNHRSTLEVPIFWFIHSEPLLLDKHYQAKALSNMVVVVQSDDDSWESHLQCNGRPILWDLRKPVKAAIAASAEYISGLLPSHLVYSHAHETAVEAHESVMIEKYNAVVSLWRRVSAMSKGLKYGDAVKLMSMLEDASRGSVIFAPYALIYYLHILLLLS